MSYLSWLATLKNNLASFFAPSEGKRYGWPGHIRWPVLSIVVGIGMIVKPEIISYCHERRRKWR